MSVRAIRVLIVDDVPESRDNVEKLLRFEPDVLVVGKASRGQEGIDLAMRLQPDIVLMDINMPDMDGITATTHLTARLPSAAVIMMSVQDEPDMLRRAMLAGAREFLAKPFSLDELITAVRHVSRLSQQTQRVASPVPTNGSAPKSADPSQARVFGVFSSKGGAGRSTLATNLAIAIRQRTNKNVILMDAAFQFGDIGVLMNVADGKTINDVVAQAQSLDRELLDDVLITHSSGVRLLLASQTPQEAETISVEHIKSVLAVLQKMTDYLVIDTRPGFDDMMLTLMDASDQLILMLTMEMTAIKDTRQFLEIAELLGYPEQKIQLVLNRYNTFSGIPVVDIAENLKREIEFKIPDDAPAVLRSINEGSPLVGTQREHKYSAEVIRLANTLVADDVSELETVVKGGQRNSGLVTRLRTAFGQS